MLSQQVVKALALNVLHSNELDTLGFPEVENPDDVAIRDLPGKNQFLFEALQNIRIIGHFRADYLQGNCASELPVYGLVDGAHAPFPQDLHDLVAVAQNLARLKWRPAPTRGRAFRGTRRPSATGNGLDDGRRFSWGGRRGTCRRFDQGRGFRRLGINQRGWFDSRRWRLCRGLAFRRSSCLLRTLSVWHS